jgi:hypothetical protein
MTNQTLLTPQDASRMRDYEEDSKAQRNFRLSRENSFRAYEEYEAQSWKKEEK